MTAPAAWAGAFAFVTDITARKQVEGALCLTNAQTEAVSQAKSTFLANMSHEVRTPLNAIIGFSDAILSELFGPLGNDRYRAYINDIHHSGLHLLELINDILNVAKIEAGRMELYEEFVSLVDVIQALFRLVQPRAVKGRVKADERRLKQVFLNLLMNSIKSTSGGRVAITARIENRQEGMHVTIIDNGIGMTTEEIKKVTEPFHQGSGGRCLYFILNRIQGKLCFPCIFVGLS